MKYSIITINFNNKEGLRHTINSVTGQTYKDIEYIIIDGGSTDGSVDVIKEYSDKIFYWISEPDKGRYNAMNKGIKQATGDYLNFMNSGDTFHSHTVLEDITNIIRQEDIITGGFYDREHGINHIIKPQEVTLLTMLKETFNHQATFYKKELFKNRLYDEKYVIQADAKFNIESVVINNCSIKITDYIIADYDFNGISSNKKMVFAERARMLEELFPTRILKDYELMYTLEEMPIIQLFPELKNSPRIQNLIFNLTSFILKCKSLIR